MKKIITALLALSSLTVFADNISGNIVFEGKKPVFQFETDQGIKKLAISSRSDRELVCNLAGQGKAIESSIRFFPGRHELCIGGDCWVEPSYREVVKIKSKLLTNKIVIKHDYNNAYINSLDCDVVR